MSVPERLNHFDQVSLMEVRLKLYSHREDCESSGDPEEMIAEKKPMKCSSSSGLRQEKYLLKIKEEYINQHFARPRYYMKLKFIRKRSCECFKKKEANLQNVVSAYKNS